MPQLTEITLGDRKFGIRRLTIGQLLEVQAFVSTTPHIEAPNDGKADIADIRRAHDRIFETISAALIRDFPDMTPKAISELEMTSAELIASHLAVLQHAGLAAKGEEPGSL